MATDALRIDLFGLQCNTGVADASGAVWSVAGIGGWASAPVRSERSLVTGRPGSTLLTESHDERVITIPGDVWASTQNGAWEAYNQLSVMPGLGATGLVVVYEPIPKSLRVRQAEQPRVPDDGPLMGRFDFLLTLVALDPFKRALNEKSATIAAGATVYVTNAGNVAASLTFTTTGSGTVIVRQNGTGQILRTRTSVASGTTFDSASRRVTTGGGVDIFPMGTPSEWLSIPAASTVTLTNQGTAPLSATWYDTYA